MPKSNSPESSMMEQDFTYSSNLNKMLTHPANSCTSLTWEQVQQLQHFQYPDTASIKRNVLVVPYPPHADVLTHNHTYFEMVYVLSGSCPHHIEKSYSLLSEGDLCILPPGMAHCLIHAEDCQIALIMVHTNTLKSLFAPLSTGQDLLSRFLHDIICKEKLNYYLLFHTEKNPAIREALFSLKEEMTHNDDYSDRLALTKFSSFLLNVARACREAEVSSGEAITSQDQKILSMIYEQYATITLAQLAETLHYSIPYCSKYLKKNIGCTFSELIQRVRFQQARNLLVNSTLPVNQIGKHIGYETPENFFRAFKKVYGVTPSQYRKNKGTLSDPKNVPPQFQTNCNL